MDLLEKIKQTLNTHNWGEIRYTYYYYGGALKQKMPYRKCIACSSYNNPNSIKTCPAHYMAVLVLTR